MKLSTKAATQLKAFHDAENNHELGKLMYELNKKKVPYTALGKAIGKSDYIAKSYIKSYKVEAPKLEQVKVEEKNLTVELARVQKVAEQNSMFADAMKLHVEKGFARYIKEYDLNYGITCIEVVGSFFRVGIDVGHNLEVLSSLHFVEYVNFESDYKALVSVWAEVLGADYINA